MLLSIITVNLNNFTGLKRTLESVFAQDFIDYEWIVIDGESTDGSKELLERYADRFSYWVSEPDEGIFNAMNKGIRHAKGKYIHFLNSGDYLVSRDVYSYVFGCGANPDIIYGSRFNVYADGSCVLDKGLAKSNLSFDDIFFGGINHTTAFIKRSLFEEYGLYDESLRIVSDSEFFLRAVGLGRASTSYIDKPISYFDMSGISKSPETRALLEHETSEMFDKVLTHELNSAYRFYKEYNVPELRDALSFYSGYCAMVQKILDRKISSLIFRVARFISKL